MRKIIYILLISSMFLTGCQNPISSAINKEGDETRAELTSELSVNTEALKTEVQTMINSIEYRLGNNNYYMLEYLTKLFEQSNKNNIDGYQRL